MRLQLSSVDFGYHGRPALSEIGFDAAGGEFIALVGPNGAGKSSLLRLCAGLLEPGHGRVELDGLALLDLAAQQRARRIAYLPPDGVSAWPMPVRRIVALGRVPHLKPLRRLTAEDEAAIDLALAKAGIADLAGRPFDQLSSGERARVLLARALATQADLILLDEPTAALDPRHQLGVMEILRAEAGRGALVIVAAHALDLVARYADRAILMQDGRIIADAPPTLSLSQASIAEVFGVVAPGGIAPTPLRLAD
ncbi:MAG: ABC transporter ATP-binding protein [Thermoanaerobaculia bacterium]|nr:ABC transporter ATP-binding protein [Thermoanaerobaculia bacterium]